MRVIKFNINETYYTALKEICIEKNIVIKSMLNVLIAQDVEIIDIKSFYPIDHQKNPKSITLKINEELYKSIMKKCGRFEVKASQYVPYLIYKYLSTKH